MSDMFEANRIQSSRKMQGLKQHDRKSQVLILIASF